MARSKEAIARAWKAHYQRNRLNPDYLAFRRDHCRKFRANNPTYGTALNVRFSMLKARCKIKGTQITLSLEEYKSLLDGKNCTYCSSTISGSKGCSLDRVNSDLGYVVGNCVPCCYICNVMKSDLTVEQFYAHLERILEHRASDDSKKR